MENRNSPKVLIVDDERVIAEYFKIVVEGHGYTVCGIARTGDQAIQMAIEEKPELIFMDMRLAGSKDGVDATIEIHKQMEVPTVYITGSQEQSTIDRINTDHPSEILIKPVGPKELGDALSRHCPI